MGCAFQDMMPPKSILWKSTDMQRPIQRVKFTKAIVRHTKIRDKNPSLGYHRFLYSGICSSRYEVSRAIVLFEFRQGFSVLRNPWESCTRKTGPCPKKPLLTDVAVEEGTSP